MSDTDDDELSAIPVDDPIRKSPGRIEEPRLIPNLSFYQPTRWIGRTSSDCVESRSDHDGYPAVVQHVQPRRSQNRAESAVRPRVPTTTSCASVACCINAAVGLVSSRKHFASTLR